MSQIVENLLQVQTLEQGRQAGSSGNTRVEELRQKVPSNVLQQYDRLRARGKKGVAFVRHGVCGQCHMQVAVGLLATLHRPETVTRCQNCGAYLCLAPEPAPILEMPPRATKPARRGRPPKVAAHVA